MNKFIRKTIFSVLSCAIVASSFLLPGALFADLVYLNDGTVLENAKILGADQSQVKVEHNGKVTTYSMQEQVKRLRYGQNVVEKVNILFQDGTIQKAYIVEQDPNRILVRTEKTSPKEEYISKEDIKQMSRKEIVLLYPAITLRTGLFTPTNTGESGIGGGPAIYAGFGVRIPFLPNSRFNAEVGFSQATSSDSDERNLQAVSLNTIYTYWWKLAPPFFVLPRAGISSALLTFSDGEGDSFQGLSAGFLAGAGVSYEVLPGSTYANVFADYTLLHDGEAVLHNIGVSLGVQYRY